jgi:hypothetical protein
VNTLDESAWLTLPSGENRRFRIELRAEEAETPVLGSLASQDRNPRIGKPMIASWYILSRPFDKLRAGSAGLSLDQHGLMQALKPGAIFAQCGTAKTVCGKTLNRAGKKHLKS